MAWFKISSSVLENTCKRHRVILSTSPFPSGHIPHKKVNYDAMGSCVPLSPIQFSTVYLHFINTLLLLTPRAGTRSFCPRYFPINGTNQSCYYHDDPYLPTRLLGYLCCMLSRSVPQNYLFPHTSSLIPAFIWNSTFICSTTSSLGVHVLEVIFSCGTGNLRIERGTWTIGYETILPFQPWQHPLPRAFLRPMGHILWLVSFLPVNTSRVDICFPGRMRVDSS